MTASFPGPGDAGPPSLVSALLGRAALRPGRRAFVFLADGEMESERLTYRALDRRARAVAALLQSQGGAGERVLLLFPPGLDFVAAFFGCLYAGAVAVPAYPPRSERSLPRLRAIARDAAPAIVLAPADSGRLRRAAAGLPELAGARWLTLEGGRAEDWRETSPGPETLAFLQYTSGSTSDPKGVMVTHGNLVANAAAIQEAVGLDERDILLGWLPLYHDMGLIGIVIQTVLLGARCVLMSPTAFLQQPMRWPRAVARYGATLSGGPDFAWDLCARRGTSGEIAGLDLSRWRVAFNGAEPVRPETLDRFARAFAPAGFRAGALCPCYGLAEATLLVSVSPPGEPPVVRERQAGSGRIAPGTEVAIVQPRSRRRLGDGKVGEIWVSGPQVAAGYWGNPKETARTFRARLDRRDWLRTGDLGFLEGGELFVAGRIKDLIVIRGRNLYPQDVERTAEESHPAFVPGGAAAFAVEAGGRERLAVALEVDRHFRPGNAGEAMAALRRAVAEEHDAEVWGIALLSPGTLPRTSSGKVRRQACREGFLARTLSAVAWDTGGDPESSGEPAEDLRGAVARALGREPRGEDAGRPLAALGLDSLGAIELQQALESGFGISLTLTELLETSLDGLAARAVSKEIRRDGACPRPGGGPTLSYGQRALWFLHRLDPEGTAYHVAFAARVRSEIDADRLGQAVATLISRHDALRTVYPERGGEPVAEIRIAPDLFAVIEAPLEQLAAEATRPFDLAAGPVFRVRLLLGPAGERVLLVAAHHIAVDLGSLVVLMDELGWLLSGESLPPAPSFFDHAAAERERLSGPEGERLWDFWRDRLGGRELPALDLPTDRPRPAVARFRGSSLLLSIPPETTAALKALAAESGATLFAVLLAAYQLLLARLSGQDEVLVGAPAAGRGRPELAGVVGYLVNPLVLRGSLEGEPTGRELLARARAEALGALEHQDFPFPLLVERLQPHRDAGRSPIFQALLALERLSAGAAAPFVLGTAGNPLALGPLLLEPLPLDLPGAQLDLSLTLAEADGGIAGRLRYDADLFDEDTASRWAACFGTLLEELVANPDGRAAELSLLSLEERRQLMAVETLPAPAVSIYSRFEAWTERTPDAPALIWQDREVTYRELADRAGRIAGALARRGIGPEDRVGIRLPRTPDLVAAILGVLRRGAAYLPLDPAYPAERIAWMAADAQASAVITSEWLRDLDEPLPLPLSAGPGGLFAVIYTSGSTGLPKGVAVEERSVAALLAWAEGAYSSAEVAGVLASTSVCFDLSAFELFVPLTRGGSVVLAENALELPRLPARNRVTLLNTVPSAAAALAGDLPVSVRTVNLAGEPIPAPLAQTIVASGRRLLNLYGPTETTVYSTGAEIGMEEGAPAIGLPLPGERAVLLDRRLQPVAPGVPGEIWIGGAGLARGYLGRPDATADRFRPDPWGPPGARLYQTGDLARRMRDGRLAFLGRLDHQVKIRGFRVEPGEVEAALAGHPAVAEAAVAARPEPGGGRRLVAWVAPIGEPKEELISTLRAHLEVRLPAFLVPAAFVVLPRLPRTPNGKLDRKALPEPGEPAGRTGQGPRTPLEEVLAGMWAELLGRNAGPADDFFALGGHSLLAARLASRVREVFGVELPLSLLFRAPTLGRLAEEVARLREGGAVEALPPVQPAPRNGALPLSFAQQRLWFLERLEPGTPRYNVPVRLRFMGSLDVSLLGGALRELARRHEALRTRFPEGAEGPVQEIDSKLDLRLPQVDLSELPSDRTEADRLAREEARRPFDLIHGPVVRSLLVRQAAGEHELILVFHHIAVDAWSLSLLLRELGALLRAEPLPPPGLQVADFALWQRERPAGEALAAGRARLAGVPDLDLPTDHPRPPVQSPRGGRRSLAIPSPIADAVTDLGRRLGATPFMVLLAAFEALLGRWSGQEDFAVGSPVAGRDRMESEGVVGLFVNTLALRAGLVGEPAFSALVGRAREDALAAYGDRDLPFERLVEALDSSRDLSRSPLFQAMLSLVDITLPAMGVPGLEIQIEEIEAGVSKLDLTLELSPRDGGWAGSIEYSADLFDPATAGRLAGHFENLLAGALANPDLPWTRLPLLGEGERHQILHEWRWGPGPAAGDSVLPVIAEQVARDPKAPAVVGEEEISYGELARRSERLAGRLAAHGVGAETMVGVRIERSTELAVAVLAVLRSGGVLLSLDPAHPPERQAALLADAGARLLLVRAGDPAPPVGWTGETLAVDGDGDGEEGKDVAAAIHPEQAAYVFYTSGSTGKPKGVVIPHRALAALCQAAAERYGMTPDDRMLGFTSPAFDVMLEETLVAWAVGAAVAPAPAEAVETLEGFLGFLERWRVTVMDLPASFWHAWVSGLAENPPPPGVRTVVAGSERLAPDKVAAWRRNTRVGLINAYGSTEVAVTLVAHDPQEGEDPVRVGRPFPRAEVLPLDAGGEPVPLGAAGEVAFGGPWLARGYLGRPDLTAERFVPHPWGDPGSRLYRTGDLGRFRADGVLELVGRIDHQMKVRGVRIEPGEVEAVLESHPEVARAAVAARPGSAGPRLVAWIVPRSGAAPDPAALRVFLAGRLPEGLVPTAWVFLEALPLTPVGKVDRRALPEPAPEERPAPAVPRSPAEAALAEVWSRALGVEPVGIHDDFFALGGDSILTLQIVAGARARGLAVTPRQLFELRTVAALAAAAVPVTSEAQDEEDGEPFPLTPIQRWFFDLDQPEPHHFNQALLLMPADLLDPGVLTGAVAALVERHDALRLRFDCGGLQRVAKEDRDLLTVVELEALPEGLRTAALTAASAQAQTGFDLAAGPLFRAVLFRGSNRLLLAAHHLAVDGVSWRVLLEDLDRACQGLPLPPRTASFRRWARLPAPRATYPLPAGEAGLEGQAETVSFELSPEDTSGLLRGVPAVFAGARPGEALLAALARASGGHLQVDIEGHGREADDLDLSRTIGWFTTLRAVNLDLPTGGGPGAALRAIREGLRRESEAPERPPVSFNYHGRFDVSGRFAPAPESPGPQRSPAARRTHRLEVIAAVMGDRLRIDLTGDRADHAILEELRTALAREIDALLVPVRAWADPEVEDLYPLTPAQQGILFHNHEAPGSGAYVEQLAWTFAGGFDRAALERAWALVSRRHAVLRTAFVEGEEPLQIVRRHAEPEWVEEDWRHLTPSEQEERLGRWMTEDRRRGFDPERAPLQRFALFRLTEDRWRFFWSHHHLLLDGWSMALVLEEVLAAYKVFANGEEPSLSARRPFRDWVEELLRRGDGAEEGFWRGLLAGFGEPTPLGIDRPARSGEEGWGERHLSVPADASRDLLALGRRRGWTPATLVYGAWALLLSSYSGTGDVVFGTVVSGRGTLPEADGIVGLLANTLPVRAGLPAAEPLGDWLDRLQALLVEIRQREATPLPAVRAWSEVPLDRPLFESLVAFENFPLGEPLKRWRGGSRIEDVIAADHTHYPLTLLAALDPDLSLTLLFARGRFEEAAIARLEGHLGALLAGMAAGEERPLSALSLLTPAEIVQIAAWTEGAPPEGNGEPVHRLFAAQAARTPEALALISAGEGRARLTYRELEERSNRLARHLRSLGVGPEVPVALCLGRSLDAVVGLLAILKAGGFCVPLDAAYPRDRLALMLEDARPAALLTWERLAAELPPAAGTILLDDPEARAAIEARSPEPLDTPALPGSLAYVIYTSGSTGRPKGVAVFHRLLSNIVTWQMAAGAARGPRRTLQFSPWSFDVCLQEIFSTLGTGGALVLLAEEWRSDGPRLWRLIEEERIERLFIPFVALELLAESAPAGEPFAPGLAEIAAAGEQLQITPAVAALFSRLPGCVLENHYGPTETHIVVTYTLTGPPESWPPLPPIGRAIAGARATVLDDGLRPAPVGVVGEVCLGGIAVCRGYLGRPDLTAERFPPDPLSSEPGARLYRSGDLGRWREDGQIEFLGRRDGQVKVRGYRVELGEIEAVLATHPAVLRAAVVAHKGPGGMRLLAAVVPRTEAEGLGADLRRFLGERLPAYMVPADLIVLDELPLTPSSKVDRKALALLKTERPVSTPPGTEIERELAAIWAEVLGAPEVGLEDGFFELGGHSLLAGRLLARIRKAFGIDLPLASLLEEPTLGGMAAAVTAALAAREPGLDKLLHLLDGMDEEEAERLLAAGGEILT